MHAQNKIDRIWQWYKQRPSPRLREVIVEHYWNLLTDEAGRIHRRLPTSVDIDDVISDGALGLLDAIEAFDPARAQFQTFGRAKIRGAILDGLRSRDPISRSTRKNNRDLESAANQIRVTTGVNPTPQEIASRMQIPLETFSKRELEASQSITTSLSGGRIWEQNRRDQISSDTLADKRQSDPARIAMRNSLREMIGTGFSSAERLITILYYHEELTMKEIGQTLDLSESRVSQMHKTILARLKARLEETRAHSLGI